MEAKFILHDILSAVRYLLNLYMKSGKLVSIDSGCSISKFPILVPITIKAIAILWSKSVLITEFLIFNFFVGSINKSSPWISE